MRLVAVGFRRTCRQSNVTLTPAARDTKETINDEIAAQQVHRLMGPSVQPWDDKRNLPCELVQHSFCSQERIYLTKRISLPASSDKLR